MNNRTKGIALAIITAVMWGIMGMFVRDLSQYRFTNLELFFSVRAGRRGLFRVFNFYKPICTQN